MWRYLCMYVYQKVTAGDRYVWGDSSWSIKPLWRSASFTARVWQTLSLAWLGHSFRLGIMRRIANVCTWVCQLINLQIFTTALQPNTGWITLGNAMEVFGNSWVGHKSASLYRFISFPLWDTQDQQSLHTHIQPGKLTSLIAPGSTTICKEAKEDTQWTRQSNNTLPHQHPPSHWYHVLCNNT